MNRQKILFYLTSLLLIFLIIVIAIGADVPAYIFPLGILVMVIIWYLIDNSKTEEQNKKLVYYLRLFILFCFSLVCTISIVFLSIDTLNPFNVDAPIFVFPLLIEAIVVFWFLHDLSKKIDHRAWLMTLIRLMFVVICFILSFFIIISFTTDSLILGILMIAVLTLIINMYFRSIT